MSITRKSLLLSAVLVLGSALGASAADLYGGGLKDAPVMAPMPAASAGWYLRVDTGYDISMSPEILAPGFTTRNVKMDDGFVLGGGIGRYFGRGFRGDLTIDHIFDERLSADAYDLCGCYTGNGHVNFKSTVYLANLYYDFNRGRRFVPYIGAGIGFAHNETSQGVFNPVCGCAETIGAGSSTQFAAAAMAGLAWKIRGGEAPLVGLKGDVTQVASGNALWLDVGYRFLYLGDVKTGDVVPNGGSAHHWGAGTDPDVKDLMSHELRVGLRYDIN